MAARFVVDFVPVTMLRAAIATGAVIVVCALSIVSRIDIAAAGWIREGRVIPFRVLFGVLLWVAVVLYAVTSARRRDGAHKVILLGAIAGAGASMLASHALPLFEGRDPLRLATESAQRFGLLGLLMPALATYGWLLGIATFLLARVVAQILERRLFSREASRRTEVRR